jgi:phosphopantetheine adenylyltransferase
LSDVKVIPANVQRRKKADDTEILVLVVVASNDYKETLLRLEQAKSQARQLKPHISHVELQIPQTLNSDRMRKAMNLLARNLRAVP